MKAFVVLAVVVGAAFGAPTEDIGEIQRVKKSYGGVVGTAFAAPCAAAAPAAPVALYLSAAPTSLNYREGEHEHGEDLQHAKKARSYYDSGVSAASAASALAAANAAAGAAAAAAQSAGPAAPTYGVFPNAKVGGCEVPLLLSCSPSVHSGQVVHASYGAAPAYGSASAALAAPAYRTDADHHSKMREVAPEKQWNENNHAKISERGPMKQWAESERANQFQMFQAVPANGWHPASGAEHLEPHHHHLHHVAGDIDTPSA